MKNDIFRNIDNFMSVCIIVFFFLAGFLGGILLLENDYKDKINSVPLCEPVNCTPISCYKNTNNSFDGLWMSGNYTKREAVLKAESWEQTGNWVCVNIKNMGYERMIEVCNHEVAHEIWAYKCQENITKCIEVLK